MSLQFPEKLEFLFWDKFPNGDPIRYKVAWGGRDGAKSWSFARALLIQGTQQPLFIVCARETMKSLNESCHRILENQIVALGLQDHYTVEKARIIGKNDAAGTEFIFVGLKHNIDNVKSLEGADRVWVEEAANVSETSWSKLIPTIRKAGSQIWISFNPEFTTDSTWKRFVVKQPPGSIVKKILYTDNPWPSEVLKAERDADRIKDYDNYLHVWEGHCKKELEGSVYKDELRLAESEGRIGKVPYDAARPVHCFFDIGWGDATAIWFVQVFMAEYRFIDFEEDVHRDVAYFLKLMQNKKYIYGNIWLPWDGGSISVQTGKSISGMMREMGFKSRSLPQGRQYIGINAMRGLFPNCWFDANNCEDGIDALRRYRYGENLDAKTRTREPVHDNYSHAADAIRTFAMSVQQPKTEATTQNGRVIHQPQRAMLPPTCWS